MSLLSDQGAAELSQGAANAMNALSPTFGWAESEFRPQVPETTTAEPLLGLVLAVVAFGSGAIATINLGERLAHAWVYGEGGVPGQGGPLRHTGTFKGGDENEPVPWGDWGQGIIGW